jgi:hypothetical protein
MYISRLFIKGFRGISEKWFRLGDAVNIIHGGRCSGKSSIIDSLLFLHRYSITPTSSLEHMLHTWFTSSIIHHGYREFRILVETSGESDESGFYGLTGSIEDNTISELYIVGDTAMKTKSGVLEVFSVYLLEDRELLGLTTSSLDENIWEDLSKKRLIFKRLPWRTIAGLVWSEVTHYGFEIAYKKVPEVISSILLGYARDLSREEKERLAGRIASVIRYAFRIGRFFRRSVIAKHIDYKNAVGPSKLRGASIDPHLSNLPWILYNMYNSGRIGSVLECLEEIGVRDGLHGVERTIDQRYYIVVDSNGKEIMREGISTSFVKALALCTVLNYSEKLVAIDDYDEYLDEELTRNFIELASKSNRQVILTTRRKTVESVGNTARHNYIMI